MKIIIIVIAVLATMIIGLLTFFSKCEKYWVGVEQVYVCNHKVEEAKLTPVGGINY